MMPFANTRVVEVGSGVALAFCGKMFADFGAEVIKDEPPGGDAAIRRMVPLVDLGEGRQESAYAAWLNTNKHGVTDDPESPRFVELVRGADVLLDSRVQPDHAALRQANPGLVIGAISWFGETGPYRDFAATEAVCRALAGGVHAIGPAEGPPLIPLDGQSGMIAGLATFVATAAGIYGGGGRRFAVSVQEALMHAMEMDFSSALATGKSRQRPGVNEFGRHYPSSIYQTADGWIGISTITPAQWRGFCAMTGRMDLGADPRFVTSEGRTKAGMELEAIFVPLLKTRTSLHWFEAGL
ncbi:MAG: CoA transferase, partial [Acetobacteraceae bacterium]|nr:CoA transferase [Acetobacteraceae bacterium]